MRPENESEGVSRGMLSSLSNTHHHETTMHITEPRVALDFLERHFVYVAFGWTLHDAAYSANHPEMAAFNPANAAGEKVGYSRGELEDALHTLQAEWEHAPKFAWGDFERGQETLKRALKMLEDQ
jgi:hypothetical protein